MRVCVSSIAVALPILALAGVASAEFVPGVALIDPNLSGTKQYDGWIGLTGANYAGFGGFPGSAPWSTSIGSNRTATNTFNRDEPGDAGLIKVSNGTGGGPYPAGASIYFGGFSGDINNNGGTMAVTDSTPVAGLQNVVFQIQMGEAWTYDFFNRVMPTLSYNGGTQRLEASVLQTLERFDNGTVEMPSGLETVYINTLLLQWDLSSIAGPITDFKVEFTGVQHGQLYGLRLDQSDTFTAIPSPGAFAMVGAGMVMCARRRRR